MMAFGWTEEYVDGLDMPRVERIFRGFRHKPPVHWLAQAFVKMPPRERSGKGGERQVQEGGAPKAMFESMGGLLLDG